jgi:hypothetical protein
MDDMGRIVDALEKIATLHERGLALSESIAELQRGNAANHARVLDIQEQMAAGTTAHHGERIGALERAYKEIDLEALEKSMVVTFASALNGITNGSSLADYVQRLVRREMQDAGIGTAK